MLCAESLIPIEMYNDPMDRIFFYFKQKKKCISFLLSISEKKKMAFRFFLLPLGSVFHMYIRFLLLLYYMRPKIKKWKVYINERNKDVENKTGILYNYTVDQLEGM